MKHIHYIKPRHAGGTDDPSNLIELTVKEHAYAHLMLYEQLGDEKDLLAYKCLMGYLNKEEIIEERIKLGGKTQGKRNAESGHLKRIANLPNKRSKGKIWITDGVSNMMIEPNNLIPDGYKKGKTQKKKI